MSVSTELNLGALLSATQDASGITLSYGVSDPDNHLETVTPNTGIIINSITLSTSLDGGATWPNDKVLVNTAGQGIFFIDKNTLPKTVEDSTAYPPNTPILYGLIIDTNMGEIDPVGVSVVTGGAIGVQAPLASFTSKHGGHKRK